MKHKQKSAPRIAKTSTKTANTMWGGRFETGPDAIMAAINNSLPFDKRLARQDIQGSIAHAAMLGTIGLLSSKDVKTITQGLRAIEKEVTNGTFPFRDEYEDIHMNIEARLKELVGEPAGRLHTARSRNDQVATDFRLWVRDHCDLILTTIGALQAALITQAEAHAATILPGYTHLQVAQPVTFGHHLLAYVEMLGRDAGRFRDCRARLNESPLGAAALAGTSFPINREMTAKALGFTHPMANSMDAVSARDFAIEYLAACAICATHLSRLAEEITLWTSPQFAFVSVPEAFTSGSSIMPQKRNPDAAELIRAKTGRINGSLITLLTVIKGLALTYAKDMQEDKEPVFDATDALLLGLRAMAGMMAGLEVNKKAMRAAAATGYSTATDLADWLVRALGIPFRKSHHITGTLVKLAEQKCIELHELSLKDMQKVEPKITKAVYDVLSVEASVNSRKSTGGTAPENVKKAAKAAQKRYL